MAIERFNITRNEMDDDTKIMLRLKNGDRAAFDELYNRFSKKIYNYVMRYTGNTHTAEDITQEVFVKMYRAAKQYEPTARFSTWIFTITTNLCINEYNRRKGIQLEDDIEQYNSKDAQNTTEDHVILNDMEQKLLKSMDALPANQRSALLLRIYGGMDYEEIARVLHVSPKAVKSLLNRARGRLINEHKRDFL